MAAKTNAIESDLQWAMDVMTAYRYLGQTVKTEDLEGSTSARFMWNWASSPGNADKFLQQTVPKATEILAKHRGTEQNDVVATIEKKTIIDLKLRLAEAVEDSRKVTP